MIAWSMKQLVAFFFSPEGVPVFLGAVITAAVGASLGIAWVPWAALGAVLVLVATSGDDDDPQHPVLA